MSQKTNRKAIEKLEALYARLPKVQCRGLCYVACGPVPMTRLEANRMRKADSGHRLPMIREEATLTCVYLSQNKRCTVYDVRPLMCRVWGVVKSLSCMHGCIPDRWLSPGEFLRIAKELERIGGELVVSTTEGLKSYEDSFSRLEQTISDEEIEEYAEKTRSLRALHGGRIVGVTPSETDEFNWIDFDKRRNFR
jgi:Fe-S-cluster containining protein